MTPDIISLLKLLKDLMHPDVYARIIPNILGLMESTDPNMHRQLGRMLMDWVRSIHPQYEKLMETILQRMAPAASSEAGAAAASSEAGAAAALTAAQVAAILAAIAAIVFAAWPRRCAMRTRNTARAASARGRASRASPTSRSRTSPHSTACCHPGGAGVHLPLRLQVSRTFRGAGPVARVSGRMRPCRRLEDRGPVPADDEALRLQRQGRQRLNILQCVLVRSRHDQARG